jgi:hypothetical protein
MARKGVESRLTALERQVAEIKVRAVEAAEFRLVDKTGNLRAVLEMTRSGPRLRMLHEDGEVALEVSLPPDGPAIRMADEEGHTRLFLGAMRDAARIGMADAKGHQRAFIGLTAGGRPTITLYDPKQKAVWSAPR